MFTIVVFLSVFTQPSIFKLRTFRHSAQVGSYFICIHEWLISSGADGETDRGGRVKQLQDTLGFHHNVSGQQQNPTKRFPQHAAWVSYMCSDDKEERIQTSQPVWRLTAVAVPLIHRGAEGAPSANAGGTRWHNKKGSGKSAEQFEEERKLLATTSLTSRKTGAGDVLPSFYEFSALARTPSVSSCQRCFQLKLRQSCNFKTNSQSGNPACY